MQDFVLQLATTPEARRYAESTNLAVMAAHHSSSTQLESLLPDCAMAMAVLKAMDVPEPTIAKNAMAIVSQSYQAITELIGMWMRTWRCG